MTKEKGLYRKFNVTRTDKKDLPGEKHCNCRYFVLDLDCDEYAIATVKFYADLCKEKYPDLANDLIKTHFDKIEETP